LVIIIFFIDEERKEMNKKEKEVFEKLADIEHQRWSSWQKYLHSKCIKNENGDLIIPADYVKHLERQINTPYCELSEKEKNSDREEVKKYWDLINWDGNKNLRERR
jgi:DNA-binding ferritin-like protein